MTAPAVAAPRSPLAANLICMASMLVWAVGLPAADVLLAALPPLVITALRLVLAAAVLLPLWALADGWCALRRAPWRRGIGVGGIGFGLGLGALAAFGSVLAFTWGSRASATAFPTLTALGRTTITLSGAAIVTLAAALAAAALGADTTDWAAIGPREIGALVLYAVTGLALSQVLWILSVGQLGIGLASLHINAAPFYVMAILYALGGPWNATQALGAAIVGVGVLIAQIPPRPTRR